MNQQAFSVSVDYSVDFAGSPAVAEDGTRSKGIIVKSSVVLQ